MLVIPAIDIIDNKVVRLSEGKYETKKIYGDSPTEQAAYFKGLGFKRIHIIDLIGSKDGNLNVKDILKIISSGLKMEIQFGGGIRTYEDAAGLLSLGVNKLILGSLPLNDWRLFELLLEQFGTEKFIIAADSQNGEIKYKGWTENSGINLFEYIEKCARLGIDEFLCTDISLDGMNMGPAFDLYGKLIEQFEGLNLIASGGLRNLSDIEKLDKIGAYAAVVGKAIYEGNIKEEELKKIAD
jgi:phosphoribosylformimino-5-aminoimidazole carboxamide ribotide isomerase